MVKKVDFIPQVFIEENGVAKKPYYQQSNSCRYMQLCEKESFHRTPCSPLKNKALIQ